MRMLRSIVRALVALIGTIFVLAAAGAAYEAIAARDDAERYPPPGRLVDVGGHRLHIRCVGSGSPTVVLAAGSGAFSAEWGAVQPRLAATARVCSFDRAGLGWSDPGARPRTPDRIATELHRLLSTAGEEGPYLLVAHSAGGKHARLFAAEHRREVAGMVLIDARHEYVDEHRTRPQIAAEAAGSRRFRQIVAVAGRLGVVRPLWASAWPSFVPGSVNLTPATRTVIGVLQARPSQVGTTLDEDGAAFESNVRLHARSAAGSLGDMPLVVLAAGQTTESDPTWARAQRLQQRLSSRGELTVVPGAAHALHLERPDLVIEAVRRVLRRARATPSPSSRTSAARA